MTQEYEDWKTLKFTLITKEDASPNFNEREIWWCSIGVNIGYEINGKHDISERPVLIIRKFNNDMFFGLPLTTKQKEYPSRIATQVNGEDADIILDQGKTYSARRLNRRARVIGYREFDKIRSELISFLRLDTITAPEGAVATNVDNYS